MGAHIEIRAGGHIGTELQFRVRQSIWHRVFRGAGKVAGEDRAIEGAVDRAHIGGPPLVEPFRAFDQRWRPLPGPDKSIQHRAPDVFRPGGGKTGEAKRARRLAVEEVTGLSGLFFHHLHAGDQIVHPFGDRRVATGPPGAAVAFVIQRPDVVAQARERIHQGIIFAPRYRQVEARRTRKRRPMHQEQDRPGIAGIGRPFMLAEHVKGHFTLLRCVLGTPDFAHMVSGPSMISSHGPVCGRGRNTRPVRPIFGCFEALPTQVFLVLLGLRIPDETPNARGGTGREPPT